MDAYSVSYTSPSRRNSSRIYQDLQTIRLQSLVQLDPEQLIRSLEILRESGNVSLDGVPVSVCCPSDLQL